MNDILKFSLGFASGATLGFIGGALYFKHRYESELQAEIDKFKSDYRDEVEKYASTVRMLEEEREEHKKAVEDQYEEYSKLAGEYDTSDKDEPVIEVSDEMTGPATAKEYGKVQYKNRTIDEYTNYSNGNRVPDETAKVIPKTETKDVYIIEPDEFAENPDYDAVTLYYYADDILADENGEIVDDPDWIIGVGTLESIGLYEDDAITVRNDRNRCDYEIFEDLRNYSDIDFSKGVK